MAVGADGGEDERVASGSDPGRKSPSWGHLEACQRGKQYGVEALLAHGVALTTELTHCIEHCGHISHDTVNPSSLFLQLNCVDVAEACLYLANAC
eukprot:m.274314 g.274314  ORF g.274314 m.274314 type:complete len:95 (-) comp17685_c0_seq5:78-362(-)